MLVMPRTTWKWVALGAAAITTTAGPCLAGDADLELVSAAAFPAPTTPDGACFPNSISPDGRFVAFFTNARNMGTGWIDSHFDCFVHDLQEGTTERVNVQSDGTVLWNRSFFPVVSPDGRFVVFEQYADHPLNVFLRDRQTGQTALVSVTLTGSPHSDGIFGSDLSADGRFVVFCSGDDGLVPDGPSNLNVYLRDVLSGQTTLLSAGGEAFGGGSDSPSISADGRFVAFRSDANGFVEGDPGRSDVFVLDRETGVFELVSRAADGGFANQRSEAPRISPDGRFVAFESYASNLAQGDTNGVKDVFVRDRLLGVTIWASAGVQPPRTSQGISISADGRFAVFETGGTGSAAPEGRKIVTCDLATGALTREIGLLENKWFSGSLLFRSRISANGRYIMFKAPADLLEPVPLHGDSVFVYDRETGETRLASPGPVGASGNGSSGMASVSENGQLIAFESDASNLVVAGDTNQVSDIYIRDRQKQITERASLGIGGAEPDADCLVPAISGDGRFVAFESAATNLVEGDAGTLSDVFVRDLHAGLTHRVSIGPGGAQPNGHSSDPAISRDGRFVAFESKASNLVEGDTAGFTDVFVHDRQAGHTRRVSVAPGGAEPNGDSRDPSITADGRYVAFATHASNLDQHGLSGIFVHDLTTGDIERVSIMPGGGVLPAFVNNPSISSTGRYVAFESRSQNPPRPPGASGHTDVHVHDRATGETTIVNLTPSGQSPDGASEAPSISADGRFVTYQSWAWNMRPTGAPIATLQAYVHDRASGLTRPVIPPQSPPPAPLYNAWGVAGDPVMSSDGRTIVLWTSDFIGLPEDVNGWADVVAVAFRPPCPADQSGDGLVDSVDLALLLGAWGQSQGHSADYNEDGFVNSLDLPFLLGAWGSCP